MTDYKLISKSVVIYAGSTSASLNISIVDDNIPECNETFYLEIDTNHLDSVSPCLIANSKSWNISVTIVDDDSCKYPN